MSEIGLLAPDQTSQLYKLQGPPAPNVRFEFGEDTNLYFQYRAKTIPNTFQRWMLRKILGINLTVL